MKEKEGLKEGLKEEKTQMRGEKQALQEEADGLRLQLESVHAEKEAVHGEVIFISSLDHGGHRLSGETLPQHFLS